jgi:hypothetical protein
MKGRIVFCIGLPKFTRKKQLQKIAEDTQERGHGSPEKTVTSLFNNSAIFRVLEKKTIWRS